MKVLDFGLAKAFDTEGSGPDLSTSSTLTSAGTLPGVILGTAAYMSPEQARGQPVDKRTDVWAFGCVLLEMLTGSTTFARPTATDTLAAVVGVEPDWESLPAGTPSGIRRVLTRCLEKDARRRLHDIADARIELEDAMAAPARRGRAGRRGGHVRRCGRCHSGSWQPSPSPGLARDRFGRPGEPPPDTRVMRLTDLPGLEEFPAISPDGRSVAFTAGVGGTRQLFVQLITGGAPLQLTRDPVEHEYPRWSPDSSSIFYFSAAAPGELQGNIWEIPALGGVPRRVVSSVGGADVSPTDGRLALFRLAKKGIELVAATTDGSRSDVVAEFAGRHVLPVSTVVA